MFEPETRVPVDVVAVIDVSSSMADELIKKALRFVVGQRKYSQRLYLVQYTRVHARIKYWSREFNILSVVFRTSTIMEAISILLDLRATYHECILWARRERGRGGGRGGSGRGGSLTETTTNWF